ncbi:unnamed protein product [Protopolystoma xenopodis]|uniref:Uncharacterized protein n=1 Tax=Protopolystoma xenopodis TaxID=117903 RepID=A0A448XQG3_9PLAT|nr:unnamed protein product [Protopolystoma xenopodis]
MCKRTRGHKQTFVPFARMPKCACVGGPLADMYVLAHSQNSLHRDRRQTGNLVDVDTQAPSPAWSIDHRQCVRVHVCLLVCRSFERVQHCVRV